jgi:hypothetical protein
VGPNTYFLWVVLWPNWLALLRTGEISAVILSMAVGVTAVWFCLVGLILCGGLWFLWGRYVVEIGSKTVRIGRALFGYEFLSTHDAVGLLRLRFSPALNVQGDRSPVRSSWSRGAGKVYRRGHYNLFLDYGYQQQDVLHMAIEENQVRLIKSIIREHYPEWYQSSLKSEPPFTFNAQSMAPTYDKEQLK